MKEFGALAYPCEECDRDDCEDREIGNCNGAYIYESHMGGLYISDEPLEYDDLYCEECGDSDRLIGYAETRSEALGLLMKDADVDGSGGWDPNYLREFVAKHWNE